MSHAIFGLDSEVLGLGNGGSEFIRGYEFGGDYKRPAEGADTARRHQKVLTIWYVII